MYQHLCHSSSQGDSQGPIPQPHCPQYVQPSQQPHTYCPCTDAPAQGEGGQGNVQFPKMYSASCLVCVISPILTTCIFLSFSSLIICVFEVRIFLTIVLFVLFKLLDISELDMVGAGREAKRRRKTLGNYISSPPSVHVLKLHHQPISQENVIILTLNYCFLLP